MTKKAITALIAAALTLAAGAAALAQSSPGLIRGQVPTAAQWNSYFAAKQDVLGFTPLNINGGQLLGPLVTIASNTSAAGFRLPHGTAPTSPTNGDVWTSTAGMFARINGATIGPITGAGGDIPSGTAMLGSLLATNIVAPGTPAAGKTFIYVDSTSKTLKAKDDAAALSTTVKASSAVANEFLTAISAAGVVSQARPAPANILMGATQRVLGRTAAGSGDGADLAATTVLDWVGGTHGQILYRNATVWTPLAPGTSGQSLITGGGAANPSYADRVSSITCNGLPVTTSGTCPEMFDFKNCSLAATVASSILTVALKDHAGSDPSSTSPCRITFRNVTPAAGTWDPITVNFALSINTNAVGATLGTANSTAFRFWVVAFNNGGTPVLALFNVRSLTSGCASIDESSLQSSTAISGAATSAGVFYTPNGTTVTSKAIKILGYVEWNSTGLATAGTYATAPQFLQTFGPGIIKPCERLQGRFLQSSTQTSNTSSTYTITSVAMTVALRSAANLVRVRAFGTMGNANSSLTTANISIFRDATDMGLNAAMACASVAAVCALPVTLVGVDRPNSISTITYAVFSKSTDNTTAVTFPRTVGGLTYGSIEVDEIQG